jgi:acyl-coenzyme A thioesterase PaaI-like protein
VTAADAAEPRGGWAFGPLVEATRRVLDAVTSSSAPTEVAREQAARLEHAASILESYAVEESMAPAGNRLDLPGLGQPGLIPFMCDHLSTDRAAGRVMFRPAHLGGRAAVHGGNIPLLFDEVLGRLAAHGRPSSRTAYLHVNYRRVTPIGTELDVLAHIVSTTGRKIFASGQLLLDGEVLADAEGLFILLRPGQP